MLKYTKILLKLLIIFPLSIELKLNADAYPWNQQHSPDSSIQGSFNVFKHEYTFATEFDLEWEGQQYARAIKSSFNLRSQYELYDENDAFAGKGVGSWIPSFGLGWLYSWAANISVYDKNGYYIGSIEGTLYTDAVAKFIFRDLNEHRIAIAYMDRDRSTFMIHSPANVTKKIGELQRHAVPYRMDYWKVLLNDETIIPPPMIQVFAVFASDREDDFKDSK